MTDPKAPTVRKSDTDIVARSARDIKTMSDTELLGNDYQGWLAEEKSDVDRALKSGETARQRAERAMARSEALLKKLKP